MGRKPAPREKVKLFDDVTVHHNYVGVLRPIQDEESNIQIPDSAQEGQGLGDFLARVGCVGPEVDNLNRGDTVLVSQFMQQPHQVTVREDDEGEEFHMFIIDADMVVATVENQEDKIREMVTKGEA